MKTLGDILKNEFSSREEAQDEIFKYVSQFIDKKGKYFALLSKEQRDQLGYKYGEGWYCAMEDSVYVGANTSLYKIGHFNPDYLGWMQNSDHGKEYWVKEGHKEIDPELFVRVFAIKDKGFKLGELDVDVTKERVKVGCQVFSIKEFRNFEHDFFHNFMASVVRIHFIIRDCGMTFDYEDKEVRFDQTSDNSVHYFSFKEIKDFIEYVNKQLKQIES